MVQDKRVVGVLDYLLVVLIGDGVDKRGGRDLSLLFTGHFVFFLPRSAAGLLLFGE